MKYANNISFYKLQQRTRLDVPSHVLDIFLHVFYLEDHPENCLYSLKIEEKTGAVAMSHLISDKS